MVTSTCVRRNPSEGSESVWTQTYWPVHTTTGREYLTLATNTTSIGRGPRLKKCAFWKKFAPKLLKLTGEEDQKAGCKVRIVVLGSQRKIVMNR